MPQPTDSDRHARVEQIFHGALARPPAGRTAWIHQACADDDDLRREVLELIESHERGGLVTSRFGNPRAGTSDADADDDRSVDMNQLRAALAGRYDVVRRLGSGGMAVVFLARDTKHKRDVALKVLRPDVASVLGRGRFLREIETTANLHHPHILALFDSGETGPFIYYVMPFVEGETLRDRLAREGRLTPHDALQITRDVADALGYAHARGLIHRDIKPANILLGSGHALVADFGIARAVTAAGGDRMTGTGMAVGTPAYMSPEQASGELEIDERSDIYSLGAMLYEMLSGAPPAGGGSPHEVIARVMASTPTPIRVVRPDVSAQLDTALERALAKEPQRRFATAAEFADAVATAASTPARSGTASSRTTRTVVGVLGIAAVVAAIGGYVWFRGAEERRWARTVAMPEIERLMTEARFADAYRVGMAARRALGDDAALTALLDAATINVDITSEPSGARVSFNAYSGSDTTWYDAGVTPLEQAHLPYDYLRLRLSHEGYRLQEQSFMASLRRAHAVLTPLDDPHDMVWVGGGVYPYVDSLVAIDSFRLDRYEVTNGQFRDFVMRGGYDDGPHWTEGFVRDGKVVSHDGALDLFRDATGRPGPATWALSRYPEGEVDYPVRGVSWYEAAAFCAFTGRSLPTYYHWKQAAGFDVWDHVLALSNFGGVGPVGVGSTGAVGPNGTHDLAGNVREWVWNAVGDRRYTLGGAWREPEYMFQQVNAIDPWSRDPTNGFRCAAFRTTPSANSLAPVEFPYFDFNDIDPVDDETFAIFTRFYDYVPSPLEPDIEIVDSTPHWVKQRVSFTAAYGNERVTAYVFLPVNVPPPYQPVVYFPGVSAFLLRSSEALSEMTMVDFIPRSGRALIYPLYKGSYERYLDPLPAGAVGRRQRYVWMTQDLQRTVDYVFSRSDLRHDAVGYMGLSFGAELAIPVALEKRFKALALVGGAFDAQWRTVELLPEVQPWNFASRITTPTILINGRNDFQHPYETGQVPFFNAIDVPARDKEFVVLDAGHIPPWNEVIKHTLDWFDRYLGEVVR